MDSSSYETDELLHQYLLFHYGESNDQLPLAFGPTDALAFPVRCVQEGLDQARLVKRVRALDIGCAVGRASFELARFFDEVIGIDYSEAFASAARNIYENGHLPFLLKETGTITHRLVATRPEGVSGKLHFEQGDAQDLRADLGSFDCVLAANLLCRLARPQDFLARLPHLLNPGGQLIITTPNTWLETFTAREFWIGATPETGEPLEALKPLLGDAFEFDATWDMPFLIREHRRKYQWSVAQASRWIRKS
ncbi:putative 4-mercaptohistidine N1-methyltransferase [Puniceicoccales bacterium CK1056]|uniref:Putative 4-mercaptohistidine N1-methyltransferase n=1 Tax=Oceanipulchritudo coccoides TaxID=2706888 RepID=A0A6B2M167_9BACT|nr:putative 4-mercaptohistidine N1-methyltransferase [Oceanipulchritudo coccoides]NDV62463.1 putative 4-mercaptohistidine N1-methyltransferase [Oceanipulchritudo coccoides]